MTGMLKEDRVAPVDYYVFDAETGSIIKSGSCQRADLPHKATSPSHIVIEGEQPAPDRWNVTVGPDGPEIVAIGPAPVTPWQVKQEANRRIVEIMPEHTQRNVLAQGVLAITTYGPDPADWPEELRGVNAAAQEKWAQIVAIRRRSDQLEVELPVNYRDDEIWEAGNGN